MLRKKKKRRARFPAKTHYLGGEEDTLDEEKKRLLIEVGNRVRLWLHWELPDFLDASIEMTSPNFTAE